MTESSISSEVEKNSPSFSVNKVNSSTEFKKIVDEKKAEFLDTSELVEVSQPIENAGAVPCLIIVYQNMDSGEVATAHLYTDGILNQNIKEQPKQNPEIDYESISLRLKALGLTLNEEDLQNMQNHPDVVEQSRIAWETVLSKAEDANSNAEHTQVYLFGQNPIESEDPEEHKVEKKYITKALREAKVSDILDCREDVLEMSTSVIIDKKNKQIFYIQESDNL